MVGNDGLAAKKEPSEKFGRFFFCCLRHRLRDAHRAQRRLVLDALFGLALLADDKMPVAGIVAAIDVILRRRSAEFARRNDDAIILRRKRHADALVEHVQRAEKILRLLLLEFFHVRHDAAGKLRHVLEPVFHEIAGRLFAAHAAGADGDDLLFLERLELRHRLRQVTEIRKRRQNRSLKMPDLVFIVVAHIDDLEILLRRERSRSLFLHEFVELFGADMLAGHFARIDVLCLWETERNDLAADFY